MDHGHMVLFRLEGSLIDVETVFPFFRGRSTREHLRRNDYGASQYPVLVIALATGRFVRFSIDPYLGPSGPGSKALIQNQVQT